ncbi:FAD-dependent monooxygenase [Actinoplanes sp. M2I2]|uniref:FAD-dependent monooxygenase n=1 Tax=Actinoplanes sp. M2I2 TaxID=1734444 RepID=UPI0024C397A1|nr:FAD-dependent monooxygenase [Actinoplanes sp. M2I2]
MRRVAIIGAGVGGLTTAIGLQRHGWEVAVFERAAAPAPVGAGLSLFANGFRALDLVGAGDAVRAIAGPEQRLTAGLRRSDGRRLTVTPPEALCELRVVHRADLHRVLADALEPGTVTYGKRVEGIPDGYDVVVAADGLRSPTRGTPVRYSGWTSWRGVTSRPVDLLGAAGESLGRGERFGLAPLPDGRVYWFGVVSVPPGTGFPDEYAEVRRRFDRWHAPIAEVLEATDPAAIVRTDIHDLARPLPTFVRGTTVLLGDAAHAMTPDLGQGANLALEDAATLTDLLGTRPIAEALRAYDDRRSRTQALARQARVMGRLLQSRSPLRDVLLRLTPPSVAARRLTAVQAWSPPEVLSARS